MWKIHRFKITTQPGGGDGRILHETAGRWLDVQKDQDGGCGEEDVRFRMGDGKTRF